MKLITIGICSLLAILFGHSAQMIFYIIGLSHVGARKNIKAGLILGYILLTVCCLVCYAGATCFKKHPDHYYRMKNQLGQLYIMLLIYEQDYNEFPKVTPEGGNGVRDLYPLYASGIMNEVSLYTFQSWGCRLKQFSKNPTIDEFNRHYIGISYNSTAKLNDPDNPPLMADQGVSSGYLRLETKEGGTKARVDTGAMVLFADGSIEFINTVNKRGKLSTSNVSLEEWARLKD
jgi:hypothetical protein